MRALNSVSYTHLDTSVVSTLSQSGRDASSQQAHEALLQNRFTTSVGSLRSEAIAKNTMRAIIDETKTIKLGDEVKMRLMEDIQIGSMKVPKGTIIVAKSNLSGNRQMCIRDRPRCGQA